MASPRKRQLDRTGLDLVEEAARLLRRAPAGVLVRYYIGSLPAMLGLLYYLTDASHSAFARLHLGHASLGIAVLYLWMKCWHTAFNAGLSETLARRTPQPWTAGRIARLILLQCSVQPWGLFLRPIAFLILLPYVWVYGFFQGFGLFADGTSGSLSDGLRRAWTQAKWQPFPAHTALGYLKVFGFFVWVNVLVFTFFAPELLRMFTGIETLFTGSPTAMLNTTVILATIAVTYLCFDPLRKALYVLRCFYGDAMRTGEDLAVELRALKSAAPLRAVAVAVLLFSCAPLAPSAAAANPPVAVQPIDSGELGESIEKVLEGREYTWRLPREGGDQAEKGLIQRFITDTINSITGTINKFRRWWRKAFSRDSSMGSDSSWGGLVWSSPAVLYTAIGLSVAVIAFLLWRHRRNLRVRPVAAQAITSMPDLRSEDVTADQLPEDGWMRLARELMEQGELRLALRASYLAGLAHLGQRQFITIARHKSNLDYESELRRRARSREELLAAFDANLDAFERAWYGEHEVTRETLGGFNANLDRIRAC